MYQNNIYLRIMFFWPCGIVMQYRPQGSGFNSHCKCNCQNPHIFPLHYGLKVWKEPETRQYFCLFSIYKWGNDTFKCVKDMLIEHVQGTIVYVPRARLYMCPGHNHRTRLANVTETF